jgi:hypothetical protein
MSMNVVISSDEEVFVAQCLLSMSKESRGGGIDDSLFSQQCDEPSSAVSSSSDEDYPLEYSEDEDEIHSKGMILSSDLPHTNQWERERHSSNQW